MPSISTALDAARSSRGYLFTVVACSVLLTALAVTQWVRESRAAGPTPMDGDGLPAEKDSSRADLERAKVDATDRLDSAERAIAAARLQQKETAAELDRLNGTAGQLQDAIVRQEAEMAKAARLRDELNAAVPQPADTAAPEDERAVALEGSLAELQKQMAQLLTRFTRSHPVVRDIERRIGELSAQLQEMRSPAENPEETAGESLQEAEENLAAAEQRLDELRQELERLNASRDSQMLRLANIQEAIESREHDIELASAELARLEAIPPPRNESVSGPDAASHLSAFGLLFSLALGCLLGGVAFVKSKPVSQTISSRAEVESILALPLIGMLPGTDDSTVPPPQPPEWRAAGRILLAAELTLAVFAAATAAAVQLIEGHSQRLANQPLSTIADGVRLVLEHVMG